MTANLFGQVETSITNSDSLLQEKLSHQQILLQAKFDAITSLNNKTLELVDGEESFHDEVPNQLTLSIVKTVSKLKSVHIGTTRTISNSIQSLQALLEIQMLTQVQAV